MRFKYVSNTYQYVSCTYFGDLKYARPYVPFGAVNPPRCDAVLSMSLPFLSILQIGKLACTYLAKTGISASLSENAGRAQRQSFCEARRFTKLFRMVDLVGVGHFSFLLGLHLRRKLPLENTPISMPNFDLPGVSSSVKF